MNSGGFENETKYLEMAIDGSLEAFNHLVTYYQTAVYNTALRIMCDASRADDITQTAFINAWKHISQFTGASFKPWILRITINACYDELRVHSPAPCRSFRWNMTLRPLNPPSVLYSHSTLTGCERSSSPRSHSCSKSSPVSSRRMWAMSSCSRA